MLYYNNDVEIKPASGGGGQCGFCSFKKRIETRNRVSIVRAKGCHYVSVRAFAHRAQFLNQKSSLALYANLRFDIIDESINNPIDSMNHLLHVFSAVRICFEA